MGQREQKGRRLTQEVLCGICFVVCVLREVIDLLTHAFKGTWGRDIEKQLDTWSERERERERERETLRDS